MWPPRRSRLLALTASIALVAPLAVLARATPADAAPGPDVFLLGDSVMEGAADALRKVVVPAYPDAVIDAAACRGLARSCTAPSIPTAPSSGLSAIDAYAGRLGDVLVIELGYNDRPGSTQIDDAMRRVTAQDVPLVLWLTLSTLNRPEFASVNQALLAADGRWPTLRVVDWDGHSRSHPDWFVANDGVGVHLTDAGRAGFAAFIAAQLDALPGIGIPPPAAQHCAAGVAIGSVVPGPAPGALAVDPPGGRFTGIGPRRLLDSRTGRPLGAGRAIELQVAGRAGVPRSAASVILNVTAADPCGPGFLTVFPCGQPAPPLASNVNYLRGEVRPNLAVVGLGTGGRVCLYTMTQTDVLVDLMGWFDPAATGAAVPLAPRRILDTRATGPLAAGEARAVAVTGADVDGGAVGVVLNLTATGSDAAGYLSTWPATADGSCDVATRPGTSSVNFVARDTVANLVIVRVGGGGRVCVYAFARTHVVVDVAGAFTAAGKSVKAASPVRVLDTRDGTGAGRPGAVPADTAMAVTVADGGRGRAPAGAAGVVLNVTAVEPAAAGFLTVYPAAPDGTCPAVVRPLASNLNADQGEVVPNLAATAVGGLGRVCVYAMARTHIVADLAGWMS